MSYYVCVAHESLAVVTCHGTSFTSRAARLRKAALQKEMQADKGGHTSWESEQPDSGWWWLEHERYFSRNIENVIIPIDFHIFQRGRYTTNQDFSRKFKMFKSNIVEDFLQSYWCSKKCVDDAFFPRPEAVDQILSPSHTITQTHTLTTHVAPINFWYPLVNIQTTTLR